MIACKSMKQSIIAAVAFATLGSGLPTPVLAKSNEGPVTTGTLVREMVDMEALTRFPSPPFKTIQFSSHDRRSNLPQGPGWFANADGFGKEPIPGFLEVLGEPDSTDSGEYLMASVDGPGAIVRVWTAGITGSLRLYLDGVSDPVYAGPAETFFRGPYSVFSEGSGLDSELMEGTLYQRDASYAPIPFQKSMKLVWTGNLATLHFYHVQVRSYPAGTRVKTFSPSDLFHYRKEITGTMQVLADPESMRSIQEGVPDCLWDGNVAPGDRREVLTLVGGPGALSRLEIRISAADIDSALRQTLLEVVADDFPAAQVESPVGDFFGAAPGINPYRSLPFSVEPDGSMVCRFVMPYRENLKVRFANQGEQPVGIHLRAETIPYDWDADRSMHFRAKWRSDHHLVASNQDVQDLPFLLAAGRGVVVGAVSYVVNPSPVPTSYGNWWGEGDEKIFVDNDVLPSTFGTGSEDFYNYSWSSPDIFEFPYCGQPRNDGPGNRGYVANQRWQILDSLPFQERLSFYMELYSHERVPELSYSRILYHYGKPGLTDDHLAPKSADLYVPSLPEGWEPAARMGAAGATFLPVEKLLRSAVTTSFESAPIWEGGRLLLWHPNRTGERVNLQFPVPDSGKYRVHLVAGLSPRSGVVRAKLVAGEDAVKEPEPIDLHRPFRTLSRDFTIYEGPLASGPQEVELEFLRNGPAVSQAAIGLDFLWIQPIKK